MGSTFKGLRCSDCMGNLEFNKTTKLWYCPYCGKEFERDLRLDDNVADITDSIRTTLSDISKYDFKNALTNLSECEKLGANHFGTLICNVCFNLFKASTAESKEDLNMYLARTKNYANKLNQEFNEVSEEEKNLYDFVNNADIYTVLYITYNSIGHRGRESVIYNYVDLNSVVDLRLNKSLLTISIKKNLINDIKSILSNTKFIDKRYSLYEILRKMSDSEDKRTFIKDLFALDAFGDKDKNLVDNYVKTTTDSINTKFLVLSNAYLKGISVNLTEVLVDIFANCTNEEDANAVFESMSQIKLKKDDVQIVLDYCLSKQCPNANVATSGLKYLKTSEGLFEVDSNDILNFIKSGNYDQVDTVAVVRTLMTLFRVSSKSLDHISTYALLQCKFDPEVRKELIDLVFEHIQSLTIKTLEDYVLTCKLDGVYKKDVLVKILDLGMNVNYFNSLLSKYIASGVDREEIRSEIVILLLDRKLKCLPGEITKCLLSFQGNIPLALIEKFKANNLYPDGTCLNAYFAKLTTTSYDANLVDYILTNKFVVDGKVVQKYLLYISDVTQRKIDIALRMLSSVNSQTFINSIKFKHNGNSIDGNLAQAFLLGTTFDVGGKLQIVNALLKHMSLKDNMTVEGKSIKFKKYIVDNKASLSQDINEICEQLGVFKLFF